MNNRKTLDKFFQKSESLVARRNQDGTAILMKLDETNLFYKLQGTAADVWAEFDHPRTLEGLVHHFSKLYPSAQKQLENDLAAFLETLVQNGLIIELSEGTEAPFSTTSARPSYEFGTIKEFNLDEIETEVLNETIYLDVFAGSDLRLKHDIAPIENALAKIIQLDGITYRWSPETTPAKARVNPEATHAGLIAQQVATLMPELVRADQATGHLAIEYRKLTSYLVESIKELNQKMSAQDQRIRELEARFSLK